MQSTTDFNLRLNNRFNLFYLILFLHASLPNLIWASPKDELAGSLRVNQEVLNDSDAPKPKDVYKCSYEGCGNELSSSTSLARHARIHKNERSYRCIHKGCKKAFNDRSSLTRHIAVHKGDKAFRCAYLGCDKGFNDSSNLARHMRIHTGEKPYKCKRAGCVAVFAKKCSLIKHDQEHEALAVLPDELSFVPVINPAPVKASRKINFSEISNRILASRIDHILEERPRNEANSDADLQNLINQIDELIYSYSRVSCQLDQFQLAKLLLKKSLLEMRLGNKFKAQTLLREVQQMKANHQNNIADQDQNETIEDERNVFDCSLRAFTAGEQEELASLEAKKEALHEQSSPNYQENLFEANQVAAASNAAQVASAIEAAADASILEQLEQLLQESRQKFKIYRSKYHELRSSFDNYKREYESSKIASELKHKIECDSLIARVTVKHQIDLAQLRAELEIRLQGEKARIEEKLELDHRIRLETALISCREEGKKECDQMRFLCEEQSRETTENLDRTFKLELDKLARVVDSQKQSLDSLDQYKNAVEVLGKACSSALTPLNDLIGGVNSILELKQKNPVESAESSFSESSFGKVPQLGRKKRKRVE